MREMRFKFGGHLVALFIIVMSVQAQPGMLDPSFAGTGMLLLGFGRASSTGKSVTLESDGKVVMAGTTFDANNSPEALVARFGTNNLLDPSFGMNGVARVPVNAVDVAAVAVQPDGKIVVAGTVYSGGSAGYDFFAARLNSDGTLDTSFGGAGILVVDFGGRDTCNALAIQGDGKIILAGFSERQFFQSSTNYMVLGRFDTNGVVDAAFANNGTFEQTVLSAATSLALEGDGNILVGGQVNYANGVFRFTTNGVLDTSFGSSGECILPSDCAVSAVAIQAGGIVVGQTEMILAGGTRAGQPMAARMSLAGALDLNFNTTGIATQAVTSSGNFITSVTPRISGTFSRTIKIIVSGYVNNGVKDEFLAVRFNNNGSADTSFGGSGVVITSLSAGNDQAYGAVEPGGALLLAGASVPDPSSCLTAFSLARYNASDGSLDTNFNGTGILVQPVGSLFAEAKSVAIQADGKIVVVGDCGLDCGNYSGAALCRFNPDGTLDQGFGSGGKIVATGNGSAANAVVIQPDGRIVIAGSATDAQNNSDVLVARFLANGTLDTSLATTGRVTTVVGTNGSSAFGLALQSDGKIVVGTSCSLSGNDLAVLRYNSDGSLDSTWNGTGKMFTAVGSSGDTYTDLAIQADGKVVASGGSGFGSGAELSMFRCNTNGSLDDSFGSFGRVGTSVGLISIGYGLALQKDSRILQTGTTVASIGSKANVVVVRYNTNGTLDSTFGSGGEAITPIGLAYDYGIALAVQTDAKIVAGCHSQFGSFYKFAVARFLTNGALDSGYGFGGVNYFDFGTGADENVNAIALDSIGRTVMVGSVGNLFGIVRVTGDTIMRINSITRLANGHIFLQGIGVPDGNHTLQNSARLGPANFTALGPVTADASGAWQYEDATAPGAGVRFYRLSYP
jgi:uncharacterized delta-60 repeat protein